MFEIYTDLISAHMRSKYLIKSRIRFVGRETLLQLKIKNIFAIGDKAYEMYEKAPDDIEVVFPMKSGVIARFDNMQTLLGTLLRTKTFSLGIGIRCCRSYRCYGS